MSNITITFLIVLFLLSTMLGFGVANAMLEPIKYTKIEIVEINNTITNTIIKEIENKENLTDKEIMLKIHKIYKTEIGFCVNIENNTITIKQTTMYPTRTQTTKIECEEGNGMVHTHPYQPKEKWGYKTGNCELSTQDKDYINHIQYEYFGMICSGSEGQQMKIYDKQLNEVEVQ